MAAKKSKSENYLSVENLRELADAMMYRNPQPVLEFVGYLNHQPVYKLDIKNPEKIKLVLIIRDTDGTILHEEVLEGENISRKYCFLREEIGNQELIVELARSEREAVVGTIRMDRRRLK